MDNKKWELAWKLLLSTILAGIGQLIMIDIAQFPIEYRWAYFASSSILLIISLAVVQLSWEPSARIIRKVKSSFRVKYKEHFLRPTFDYWLNISNDKELFLYVKSSVRNKKCKLQLHFHRLELANASPEQKDKIGYDLVTTKGQTLFDDEIIPNDIRVVTVAKFENGNWILVFKNTVYGVLLFPGKNKYIFGESGTYERNDFSQINKNVEFFLESDGKITLA